MGNSPSADVVNDRLKQTAKSKATSLSLDSVNLGSLKNVVPKKSKPLKHVTTLSLSGNEIKEFPEDMRLLVPNIVSLNLDRNKLTALPQNFDTTPLTLTTLTLNNNLLTTDCLHDLALLGNLTHLHLDSNRIDSIDPLFPKLPHLKVLSAKYNQISSVAASISRLHNLQTLDLSKNRITTVSSSLWTIVTLQSVNLSCNKLTELIPESATATVDLSRLRELHTLDISENSLTSQALNVLFAATALTSLNASSNAIDVISQDISRLVNLTSLDLSNNKIAKLTSGLGGACGFNENMASLRKLVLRKNKLESFAIGRLPGLKELDISNNRLQALKRIGNCENLTVLHASRNAFSSPTGIDFTGMKSLGELDLSWNELESIEFAGFDALTGTLKKLDIGYNNISFLPNNLLSRLKKLHMLVLDGNEFSRLAPEMLVSPGEPSPLMSLSLRFNGFPESDVEIIKKHLSPSCLIFNETAQADLIEPKLYLGGRSAGQSKALMDSYNITHVILLSTSLTPRFPKKINYKHIQIEDEESAVIAAYFNECFDFIESALASGGSVLVHCEVGISRSASIVIAYLIKKKKMSFEEALALVKSKRSQVSPNRGFASQLMDYAKNIAEGGDGNIAKTKVEMSVAKVENPTTSPKRVARSPSVKRTIPRLEAQESNNSTDNKLQEDEQSEEAEYSHPGWFNEELSTKINAVCRAACLVYVKNAETGVQTQRGVGLLVSACNEKVFMITTTAAIKSQEDAKTVAASLLLNTSSDQLELQPDEYFATFSAPSKKDANSGITDLCIIACTNVSSSNAMPLSAILRPFNSQYTTDKDTGLIVVHPLDQPHSDPTIKFTVEKMKTIQVQRDLLRYVTENPEEMPSSTLTTGCFVFNEQAELLALHNKKEADSKVPKRAQAEHPEYFTGIRFTALLPFFLKTKSIAKLTGLEQITVDASLAEENQTENTFKTLSQAISKAQPKQLIFVKNGTYSEPLTVISDIIVVGESTEQVIIKPVIVDDEEAEHDGNVPHFPVVTIRDCSAIFANVTIHQLTSANCVELRTTTTPPSGAPANDEVVPTAVPQLIDCKITGGYSGIDCRGYGLWPIVVDCEIVDVSAYAGVAALSSGGMFEFNLVKNCYRGFVIQSPPIKDQQQHLFIRYNQIVQNEKAGIFMLQNSQARISGNTIRLNRSHGIEVKSGNPHADLNAIYDNQESGVFVYDDAQGLFERNNIYHNEYGVSVKNGTTSLFKDNDIWENRQSGVFVDEKGCGVIAENQIRLNLKVGVAVESSGNPEVTGNQIFGNLQNGILCQKQARGTYSKNKINDNRFYGFVSKEDSTPDCFENEIFSNNRYGVHVAAGGKGIFRANLIHQNKQDGVCISGEGSTPTVVANKIAENKKAGIQIDAGGSGVFLDNNISANFTFGVVLAADASLAPAPSFTANTITRNRQGGVNNLISPDKYQFDNDANNVFDNYV